MTFVDEFGQNVNAYMSKSIDWPYAYEDNSWPEDSLENLLERQDCLQQERLDIIELLLAILIPRNNICDQDALELWKL